MKDILNFSTNISQSIQLFLENDVFSNYAFLIDENTEKHCLPFFKTDLLNNLIKIPSGEKHKNLGTCQDIWERMSQLQMDRSSLLINLGGGVIGDMGAFCASTYMRGIRFINLPTTLLSMTDAAIGGKTGINFQNQKNQIGLFSKAERIFVFPRFLETLDPRELKSGYAETLKHAIIADPELWESTTFGETTPEEWTALISRSSKIKEQIVNEDFDEKGKRKCLNFGHNLGHLIEAYHLQEGQSQKLHGEAIAEGMLIESIISNQRQSLSDKDLDSISDRLKNIYSLSSVSKEKEDYILTNLIKDKKTFNKTLSFSLPEKIGKVNFDIELSLEEVSEGIRQYNNIIK